MTKVFFDAEFTGLNQNATLISLGLVTETGETFYCEFTDYDLSQVNSWIRENVLANLIYPGVFELIEFGPSVSMTGNVNEVRCALITWFAQFDDVEIWGDCLAWDWVLFCEVFGGAFSIPVNIYYIPFDICTVFKMKGIDPDITREKFAKPAIPEWIGREFKHNALWDASVIKACYEKLERS